jgi:hypothetical protein
MNNLDKIPLETIEYYLFLKLKKREVVKSQRYEEAAELREKEREIIRIYPDIDVDWQYSENLKEYCNKRRRDEKINTIIDEN